MAITPITGDQRLVKRINQMALLRLVREASGLSRADLSTRSGLTRSTISALIKELIDEGWLKEEDALVTGSLGRRPTPLRFDGARMVLLGADLGPDAIRVATTSISGQVLESAQAPLRSADPDVACHQLVELVAGMSAKVTRAGARLLGIGIGLHGPVDKRSGMLEYAPTIGWREVDVGRRMDAKLQAAGLRDVPVYYQNEADLAAVAETEFCARPAADPLVYVSCGVGVGAGIMLNEALFTGATGSAGEIGHTTLVIDGNACSCGRLGCAEAYIGLRAIAKEAGCLRDGQQIDYQALRQRMATNDARTRAAFARAGLMLGVLLQNAWTTFNPQAIVLGGRTITLGGETLLDATNDTLNGFAQRVGLRPPKVRTSTYADLATAVGGAAYVLSTILHPHQQVLQTRYMAPQFVKD